MTLKPLMNAIGDYIGGVVLRRVVLGIGKFSSISIPDQTGVRATETEDNAVKFSTVAAAIDSGDFGAARRVLLDIHVESSASEDRRLVICLWRLIWSAESSGDLERLDIVAKWCNLIERCLGGGDLWNAYEFSDHAARVIGADALAHSLTEVLWDQLGQAGDAQKYEALTLSFIGGDGAAMAELFRHFLESDPKFVPDYWQFQTLARRWSEMVGGTIEERIRQLITDTDRADLSALIEIYLLLLRQAQIFEALEAAQHLDDPVQRKIMARYLVSASQSPVNLEQAVKVHDQIAPTDAVDDRLLMRARLDLLRGNWTAVTELTSQIMSNQDFCVEAVCLRALALAHLGDADNSQAATLHVRFNRRAPWFMQGRAALIGMSARMLRDGLTLPTQIAAPALDLGSGRPMVQSLWIGPRLRWIERMSMSSFLLNGWRYKLYVYDQPEGVPDGVELADAAAILPRDAVFREGGGSGAHSGSFGAFSDLFRYALLVRRGGLWTDTDAINLRPFEPTGARLVATEWTDAGILGPNGALMASPANDPVQRMCLEHAEALVTGGGIHFARIGPQLLAEVFADGGMQGYTALPPEFMNPVGWMETGKLVQPFEIVQRMPWIKKANNLHVYTETWRLIGLPLDRVPQDDGFLPVLYDRIMNASGKGPNRLMELLE